MSFRYYIAYCFFVGIANSALAQNQQSDSSLFANAMRYHREAYQTLLGQNIRLYNGTDYKEVNLHYYDEGHPYFESTQWIKGAIEYDGQRYENIDLTYDLVNDKVLTRQFGMSKKIELIHYKVNSFELNGHTFIRISKGDSLIKLPAGFYDQLVTGDVSLYAKRKKEFREYISAQQLIKQFKDQATYFLVKEGVTFPVKTKKDLYRVMGTKKSLIKNEFSKRNIEFRNNKEGAIILAAKLYNTVYEDR